MGGNALSVPVVRLPAEEFKPLAGEMTEKLSLFINGRVSVPLVYGEKESFGDLDLIVEQEALFAISPDPEYPWSGAYEWARSLGATEFSQYGPGPLSFGLPLGQDMTFQVDLIATPAEDFDCSFVYYSFNDLGNLMGQVAHNMGLKFGHKGLLYPMRRGTQLLGEIVVTKDMNEAMRFMGFDYNRWQRGFDTYEDIFLFVSSTPHFSPSSYQPEELNSHNRVRNKKRKTYQAFLEWMTLHDMKDEPGRFDPNPATWLNLAKMTFPDFALRVAEVETRTLTQETLKTKINGRLVSEWTGLSGLALGEAMSYLRDVMGGKDAMASIFGNMDEDGVRLYVLGKLRERPIVSSSLTSSLKSSM